jgi:hypothetical protein
LSVSPCFLRASTCVAACRAKSWPSSTGRRRRSSSRAVSAAGSLPEVCGDAAIYFEPTSVDEIAEAIFSVLERPGHLIERGLERASQFTWDATARRHDEVYRALAAA